MVEHAATVSNNNADILNELANQYLLLGKTKDAAKTFKNATVYDESSITALIGMLFEYYSCCYLL